MKKCSFGIIAILSFQLFACTPKPFSCDGWAAGYKNNTEFSMVYKFGVMRGSSIYLYGYDLKTGEFTQQIEGSGWISEIYTNFKLGDTLIKKRGEYVTTLKRAKGTLVFPVKCEGKIYK